MDYPDYVWDIFAPKGKSRPTNNSKDSSRTTFEEGPKNTNECQDFSEIFDDPLNVSETFDELCSAIDLTL